MNPTIGRIVHIEMRWGAAPAIVTSVRDDGTITATAFVPNASPVPLVGIKHDEAGAVDTWHWPERVS
jgi:hypothetical protein